MEAAISEILFEVYISITKRKQAGNAYCQGKEGTPKGRRTYGDCENDFNYSVKIEFKSPEINNDLDIK